MKKRRVLILSKQILFQEAITRLLKELEEVELLGSVESLEEARPWVKTHRPQALIVDYTNIQIPIHEVVRSLGGQSDRLHAIFLTLENNEMIMCRWQRICDVSIHDLAEALRVSEEGE